jgi:hypothetical protein
MSTQVLPPASYSGPSGGLKKSTIWLASEDVGLDVELTVKILDVELHKNVKFDGGRTEEKVPALKFERQEKHMILNSTNRKMLVRLFGMDTKDWRGKWVALYVDPEVKMAGQKVNGLRIRPAQAQGEPPQQQAAPLENLPDAWATWGLSERGTNRASLGTAALRAWWDTLSVTDRKLAKPVMDSELKQAAEQADKSRQPQS